MKFSAVVEQVLDLLQRQGRVSYRMLKQEFALDDDFLADLKEELLYSHAHQVREEEPGLVWVREGIKGETAKGIKREREGETAKVWKYCRCTGSPMR
ncbi:MAG: hypothetical protein AB7G75_23015 [Candidatus Binatia bacterium]